MTTLQNRLLPLVFASGLAVVSARSLSACGDGFSSGTEVPPTTPTCPTSPLSIEVERGNEGRCHETNPPYNPDPTVQVLGVSQPGMVRLFAAVVPPGNSCPSDWGSYIEVAAQEVSGAIPYTFFPLRGLRSDTCLRAIQEFTNTCAPLSSTTHRFSCGF